MIHCTNKRRSFISSQFTKFSGVPVLTDASQEENRAQRALVVLVITLFVQ
jgi:hypothetical protein